MACGLLVAAGAEAGLQDPPAAHLHFEVELHLQRLALLPLLLPRQDLGLLQLHLPARPPGE